MRCHILREATPRDAESTLRLLGQGIRAISSLQDRHHLAGAADGAHREHLAGGPLKVLRSEVKALMVLFLHVELRVANVVAAAVVALVLLAEPIVAEEAINTQSTRWRDIIVSRPNL